MNENSGTVNVPGFVTHISAGPANESGQTVQFIVSVDNASLFTVAPSIAPDGTLTYTLAPNVNGTAIVTVHGQDNGGTGGASPSQTFAIHVIPTPPQTTQVAAFAQGGSVNTTVQMGIASANNATFSANAPNVGDHGTAAIPFLGQSDTSKEAATHDQNIFNNQSNNRLLKFDNAFDAQSINKHGESLAEEMKTVASGNQEKSHFQSLENLGKGEFNQTEIKNIVAPAAIATTLNATDMNSLKLQKRGGIMAAMNVDLAGVNVKLMGPPVTWKEGGNLVLHLSLRKQPTAKVVVNVKTSDSNLASVKPSRIEFNPANWNYDQEITVFGLGGESGSLNEDETVNGGVEYTLIFLPLESSDASYREFEISSVSLWALDASPRKPGEPS